MSPLEWRKNEGLTLDELAAKIGFAKGYLNEVENGLKPGSLRLAHAYHDISKGKVSLADFKTNQ